MPRPVRTVWTFWKQEAITGALFAGVGNIKLPLSVEQADALGTRCAADPYG